MCIRDRCCTPARRYRTRSKQTRLFSDRWKSSKNWSWHNPPGLFSPPPESQICEKLTDGSIFRMTSKSVSTVAFRLLSLRQNHPRHRHAYTSPIRLHPDIEPYRRQSIRRPYPPPPKTPDSSGRRQRTALFPQNTTHPDTQPQISPSHHRITSANSHKSGRKWR